MKQKRLFRLLQTAVLFFGVGVGVYGQTESTSCRYAIDADLQKICLTPDTLAEPHDGMGELMYRLAMEVSHPTVEAHEISGTKTVIRFIIDENGRITGKLVLNRQFHDCDVDAQMFVIVESMSWKPAYCDGKPVPTEFILPLRMYLD